MKTNDDGRNMHRAIISLLKINENNYLNEIKMRLEMLGFTFPTSKLFEAFRKSKLRIVECNEMKIAWLNQGENEEMLLAWWC